MKEVRALSPLLFNFPPECATGIVQVNQDGLKYNATYQLLVYADEVNLFRGSVHTVKENAEVLVVASKEIGLEVNTDKTNNKVMSRDQNARRSHRMNIDNRFLTGWKSSNDSGKP